MGNRRRRIPARIVTKILTASRRRCCLCFGLNRDEGEKKGQIAHLDQNSQNVDESNLAFLCFEHHDAFDSKTSQSRALTRPEVEHYRSELYRHLASWGSFASPRQLLNFLAASIEPSDIAKVLVKIGYQATAFPAFQIKLALTERKIELTDADLAYPLLHILDHLASWGLVTYKCSEPSERDECFRFSIDHLHPEVSKRVLQAVEASDVA